MNKTLLIFLSVMFFSITAFAQPSNYLFSGSTTTYTAITGTDLGAPAQGDDVAVGNLPIGFPFNYNGQNFTVFAAASNGFIELGSTLTYTSNATSGWTPSSNSLAGRANIIAALWDDNNTTGGSIIYSTTGSSPNQVLTVQWTNMHVAGSGSSSNPTISMQMRLYETSNRIEFTYGPTSAALSSPSISIGLSGNVGNFLSITPTSATSPYATTSNVTENTGVSNSALFPAGTDYMLSPPPPCVTPASLAASVNVTPGVITAAGSFTAAPPAAPDGYLVIRTTSSSQPVPVNGTVYTVGSNAIGYIEYVNAAAGSWNSTGLSAATTYYYWVFSYNNTACSGGPLYSASATNTSITTTACAISGVKSVGPGGDYPTLKAAADAMMLSGVTGPVILELNASYTNTTDATFPITLGLVPCASATNTITIRPAAGAGAKTITGSNTTAILDINGGNYWIIDGRQGGTGSSKDLTIANTSTATGGSAIRFINEGANNVVKYAVLKGSYPSASSGVVVFSTTTGPNGNDNNTIDNCDIDGGAAATASPTLVAQNGIYASGTTTTAAQGNSGNVISNCNIFNNFVTGATATSAGILVLTGNTDWTINANSIYQTSARTVTTGAATVYGISIANTSGNNFVVTNNFIGGSAASAGGSAWTVTGAFANRFNGIGLSVGTTTASSVQGNTVANFSFASTSSATANSTSAPLGTGVWGGIMIAAGNVNVGTAAPNNIGSSTGTGSVLVTVSTNPGATANGIGVSGSGVVQISNNNIGSITTSGGAATISTGIIGIQSAGTGTVTINNNTIGSTSTASSLNASLASTGTTAQVVNGILNSGAATAINITNNTIANLNNAYVPSAANTSRLMVGIASSSGVNTITGNTIRNLSTAAQGTGTTSAASVIGISLSSGTAGSNISQNIIHSLSNTHATAAVLVTGIYYNGATSGTNVVSRNFIHSLSVSSSSATANLTGIYIGGGIANYQNNFIRLGINSAGASVSNNIVIAGIDKQTTSSNNIYFNSVYIGGSAAVSTTANTFAFRRASTGTDAVQNNILFNARSNGSGGTGKHYAAGINAVTTLTINNNDYFANGTGGIIGYVGSPGTTDYNTLSGFAGATAQDGQSLNIDPAFTDAVGAVPNLHIVSGTTLLESGAVSIPAITNDFDGDVRPGTPSGSNSGLGADIGADEFNGINPNVCSGTPASGGTLSAGISVTCSGNTVSFTLTGATAGAGISYQYQTSPAGANTFADVAGATSANSSFPIVGNTDIRVVVKCLASGLSVTSNIVTVNGGFCTYDVVKSNTAYTSIAGTGTAFTGWRNASNISDDNLSGAQNIGFSFPYKGQTYTQISASTNGFITFNVGTAANGGGLSAYGYQNTAFTATSSGSYLVLAPFYDDQVCAGNPGTLAALASSIKYQLDGTAPNRVFTVEWIGMETYNNPGPNLNYQVKLYETTGVIEYVYGTMEFFNGTADFTYSYSTGLNGASVSASPTAVELQTQQVANVQNFSSTPSNALAKFMDCNYKFTFTPANYSGAATTPALTNDGPINATTLAVNSAPCTALCGTYYSTAGATATAGIAACGAATPGTADDDVWFKFTATASATNISVKGGGGYDPVVQLFSDTAAASLFCVNATGSGLTETLNAVGLTVGNLYYIRVYHAGAGNGAVSDISICVNEVILPPSNDDPCGAQPLTEGAAGVCTPYEDTPGALPSKTSFVGATNTTVSGVTTPSCSGASTSVQDVWFTFVPTCVSENITVTPKAGTNVAFQVYSATGSCPSSLALTSVTCINSNGTGQAETVLQSGLTPGNTYYIRVYPHPSGQGGPLVSNSQFSICVNPPALPSCVTNSSPADASAGVTLTPTLSWASATGAVSYDVYLGTPDAASAALITNVTTTSYTIPSALAAGTVYYWYIVPRICGAATGCISNATSFTTIANCSGTPSPSITPTNVLVCGAGTGSATFTATVTPAVAGLTYQWESSPDGSTWTPIGGATSASYSASGVTTTTYYHALVTCSGNTGTSNTAQIFIGAGAPANDDCANAVVLTHSTSPAGCVTTSGTTACATTSSETSSCFFTSQDDDVWYSFVAAAGAVKIQLSNITLANGTMPTQMGIGFHTACGTADGLCAFTDIIGGNSSYTIYGLTIGSTYKIRILTSGTGGRVNFNICLTVPPITPGTTNTCVTGGAVTINTANANNTVWVPLFNTDGNLIAEINANGNDLGTVTPSVYTRSATPLRNGSQGGAYMNRNIGISVGTQPSTPVSVRLYFTDLEKQQLDAAVPGANNASDIVITKESGGCAPAITGNGTRITQNSNGLYGPDHYVEISVSSFSDFFLHKGALALPVSIEYFKGSKAASANYLTWRINCTSAPSVDITLERSGDARSFKGIDQQNATSARCLQEFNYTDHSPLSGINYYRLRIVSPDGAVRYSSIVALINKDKGFELISVAPNPVKNSTVLTISTTKGGMMTIAVTDLAGRIVAKQNVSVIAGSNAVNLDFSSLGAGTYNITAVDADGEKKTTGFVKF